MRQKYIVRQNNCGITSLNLGDIVELGNDMDTNIYSVNGKTNHRAVQGGWRLGRARTIWEFIPEETIYSIFN